MNNEYAMTVNIKALYDQEMKMMDPGAQKKALQWKKHFDKGQ